MSCKVYVDPGPHISGSEVRGRLECDFKKSEKIRSIKIRVSGDEHTEWIGCEEQYNELFKKYETIYFPCNGDNNIFKFEIILFGGGEECHVGPGIFNYPFSFVLPANLPATFSNHYGSIHYSVIGIVDIPWGLDYSDIKYYEVQSFIDLNTFPMECFQPVSTSDTKTVCCWCCAQGEITFDININKSVFVPGENIKLYMTLTNMSNSNVEGVAARFVQYVRSIVEHPTREYKQEEYEFGYNTWSGVGAHGENKYDMEILIPAHAPYPNLNRSTLFEISYDVEIRAAIDGCHSNMELSFSIAIGHIQHQSQLNSNAPPSIEGYTPGYPREPDDHVDEQPDFPDNAPSYPYPIGTRPRGPFVNFEGPNTVIPQPHGPQMSNVSGPPYPGAASSSGISSPPEYKSVYPGGPPNTPPLSISPKEKESIEKGKVVPSAPPSTDELPPSYEDASKNKKK